MARATPRQTGLPSLGFKGCVGEEVDGCETKKTRDREEVGLDKHKLDGHWMSVLFELDSYETSLGFYPALRLTPLDLVKTLEKLKEKGLRVRDP